MLSASFWCDELARALQAPELDGEGAKAAEAAFRVALCLGYCRILGAELPEGGACLSVRQARAAGDVLVKNIATWVKETQDLPARWDSAPVGTETDLCVDILQARMDAWAVSIAVGGRARRVRRAVARFDRALREVLELLSTLAGSQFVTNWRRAIKGRIPWWLGDALDNESRRVAAEAEAAWQELRARGKIPAPRR